MVHLINKIKITYLKRCLAQTVGNIRHYTKMIETWKSECEKIVNGNDKLGNGKHLKKLEGSILYFEGKVQHWKNDYEHYKDELIKLGVNVELKP